MYACKTHFSLSMNKAGQSNVPYDLLFWPLYFQNVPKLFLEYLKNHYQHALISLKFCWEFTLKCLTWFVWLYLLFSTVLVEDLLDYCGFIYQANMLPYVSNILLFHPYIQFQSKHWLMYESLTGTALVFNSPEQVVLL